MAVGLRGTRGERGTTFNTCRCNGGAGGVSLVINEQMTQLSTRLTGGPTSPGYQLQRPRVLLASLFFTSHCNKLHIRLAAVYYSGAPLEK